MDVAGLGSRTAAGLIDLLIQGAVGLLLFAAIAGMEILDWSETAGVIVASVGWFLLFFGYYPLFEGLWNGQSPGKRVTKLRVVQSDGQPLTLGPLIVRNLVRIVDFLPFYYMIGSLAIVLTSRSQRLGDLAGGTIVVRERVAPTPVPLADPVPGTGDTGIDTTGLSEQEYGLVRSFLTRREELTLAARASVSGDIAKKIRPVVRGAPEGQTDEQFLEWVAKSYRSRHAR